MQWLLILWFFISMAVSFGMGFYWGKKESSEACRDEARLHFIFGEYVKGAKA